MRVVDYNEDFQDFSFFSNRQQKTTEFKTLATTSVSCCTLPLAASLALIWRFSFKIIQTEKSPTAAATKNRDADTAQNIFRSCSGSLRNTNPNYATRTNW